MRAQTHSWVPCQASRTCCLAGSWGLEFKSSRGLRSRTPLLPPSPDPGEVGPPGWPAPLPPEACAPVPTQPLSPRAGTCLSGLHRNGVVHRERCCFHGDPSGSWVGRWMPGSPKIWGTLELEKQGDSCRGTSRPRPSLPWPREGGSGGQPRRTPRGAPRAISRQYLTLTPLPRPPVRLPGTANSGREGGGAGPPFSAAQTRVVWPKGSGTRGAGLTEALPARPRSQHCLAYTSHPTWSLGGCPGPHLGLLGTPILEDGPGGGARHPPCWRHEHWALPGGPLCEVCKGRGPPTGWHHPPPMPVWVARLREGVATAEPRAPRHPDLGPHCWPLSTRPGRRGRQAGPRVTPELLSGAHALSISLGKRATGVGPS